MPTPVSIARQCLTDEAAITLRDAVVMAGRRGHAQTTSLHFVSSLLSLPSSCLREACSHTRNNAFSTRVQFKALELCLAVSIDRLPSSPNKVEDPPLSNSFMAAIKRSQANQRRQPENFSFYQQQLHNQSASSSVPLVKVELRNLIISILDDPVVSRVFGEAGFMSYNIKLAIVKPVHQLFTYSRGPPLFLCNLASQKDLRSRGFSFPFLGFSGGEDDDCRRIGEVLIKNKARNPLLLGTCANGSINSFFEMVEKKKGGGILPVELCGLMVVSMENELLRFVTGECDEELVKLKFEEIGNTMLHCGGAGVVVNFGDLMILARDDASIDSCRHMICKLMSLFEVHGGKLWLIGWARRYETYLKVLKRFPNIDKDWDLQILTITSSGSPKEEPLLRSSSSLMETFVPLGGFFSAPAADITSPLSCSYQTSSRCHLCNEKCKQEINALSKNRFNNASVVDQYQSSLPSWLQLTQVLIDGRLDASKAQDDKMVMGAKIASLQRKWDNLCRRLHYDQPLPKASNLQLLGSQIPSVVGFQVVDQDINDEKSSHNNASSSVTGTKNMNTSMSTELFTISSSKESSLGKGSLLSKFKETTSKSDDERGLNSQTSVTSVATDLDLCMASTSAGKEQEPPINQTHDMSCNASASTEVVSRSFFNHSPLSSSSSLQYLHKQLDPKDFKKLFTALLEKVAWQEEAVNAISQTVAWCRTRNERNQCASRGDIWLNFLGPDKLGKKKVAISLAEILYGSTNNLICVDLSLQGEVIDVKSMFDLQVTNRYDVRFRGKHVVDYVADKLRNNPLSVVFLENVDKADLLVQKSLSQAVMTGKFSDSHGREVSTGNTIFLTTSNLAEERSNLAFTKTTAEYCEEDILAAKGWKIQILIAFDLADDVKSVNAGTLVSTTKRSPGRIFVNKRKLTTGSRESIDQQCGSSEMAKRAHKESSTYLDLNLTAEENENFETFTGDCGSDSWLKQLLAQFDKTVIFRPIDFDSLAENLLKEIKLCFHKIIGQECLLEIDTKVLEQMLAATFLTDNKKVEDWIQQVLGRGFVEAQERYSLSARSVVKLVTCDSSFPEVISIPGVFLPGKITVN